MHKVLIIKTGYSEILDKSSQSRVVSLGDILRTTPLLHLYKKDNVTWVTDEEAFPLLEGNPYINKLLPFDWIVAEQLKSEEFDTLINLEKIPGICALAQNVNAWKKYGFRFDAKNGGAEAYDKAFDVLAVSADPMLKKTNQKTSQELLFNMVGAKWNGEEYVLGYKPRTSQIYDVGLNTVVGQKWPTKAWSKKNWDKLEEMLQGDGLKVARQDKYHLDILTNLHRYIDWINSSRLIISNDSLGLHLGIALEKKVLGLFGPTPNSEVHFYGRGEAILPESDCRYLPCFEGECKIERKCMNTISVEIVANKIIEYLKK